MGYIFAVCGKGGTGKTTITALLINWLKANRECSVLAVDADPNSNLSNSLGVAKNKSLADIVDSITKDPKVVPSNMSKDHYIEYQVQLGLSESNGFDLLSMGHPEGPGCYCYVNNVLRNIMQKLIKNYDFVVIDNEAGMEHLSRRTMRAADCLLLVSDHSVVGLRSAKRILDLARDMGIKFKAAKLIVNRADKDCRHLEDKIKESGLDCLGCLSEDKTLGKLSVEDKPVSKLGKDALILGQFDKIVKNLFGLKD
ncbi:MAG: AAA family ATPase [Candidatus Omnitrophota bacterium]